MTWENLSYAAMLGFCLAATLPLIALFKLDLPKQWRRVLLSILIAGTPFLVWDLIVTHAGHWWFDDDQTLPWRILDLPLEEISFFIVIPLVTIITLEGVRSVLRRKGASDEVTR
ncbi:lycopene cyclase domain-containing protein [Yimella sp. cx-51]|uniref:lycopene cyclase domain-containing protein n=1 Tax=Yimella sp. cx-51 TaxID=2770551 RepID=UPI00165E6091|nr:lycopene cyclase domain-containing protein [Yimella sp. cx-51]MBC9956460.1 lycopene cyclase domain-containing protein [Yimella sp. cx-51]QTH38425.1 lycopene cyclase domain-containing protein [Yimella sp. cx-51]